MFIASVPPPGLGNTDTLCPGLCGEPCRTWGGGLVRGDVWPGGWVESGVTCCRSDCEAPLGTGGEERFLCSDSAVSTAVKVSGDVSLNDSSLLLQLLDLHLRKALVFLNTNHGSVPAAGDVPVQYCAQPTNGVVYFRAFCSLNALPPELRPYVPLFCSVLTK